jgi:hypothetical protein
MHTYDNKSSSEGVLSKLVSTKRDLPTRRTSRHHRLGTSRKVAQLD